LLHCHCAFRLSCVQGFLALPKQQPALIAHYSVHPLMVNLATIDLQPGPSSSTLAASFSIVYS